ncbi:MAG TPA: TldD/PmbA family protein [Ktedonobacterales bacterium]
MQDLAETALNVALQLGASYADVRVMERFTEAIQVKNDRVEGVASGEEIGLNVRVLFEGAWGFASSARLDVRAAQQTAALAVRIAKASALVSGRPVDLSPLPPQRGVYATPIGRDPFAVPIDQKVDVLLRACAAMQAVKGVTIASGQMAYGREHKIFASSQGSSIEQTLYDTGAGIEAAAMAEGEVQVRSYPNSSMQVGSAGYELIEALDLVGNAPRVAEEAVQLLSAKQCPSDVITTVVLDGPQTALQIHESCGHPIELDRVLGMEAGFVGKSFLTLDKLGTFRYGSDVVTIVADATTPGGLGTFGWDDEGVPAQSTDIVKDGRFVGYLMSRDTAPLLGLASNGCVRADGWNRLPMIRMTNVSLLPGTWKLDDLIADTEDGLYLCTNRSWSIDDRRLNFQFGTEIGWEIKHGKLGAMIKNPTYTGITPEFWGGCDAVCDRGHWTVWGTPNCGKGEPIQVMRTGHGAAPARFRNVRVGVGKWDA